MAMTGTVLGTPSTPMKPPRDTVGVIGWLKTNLFSSIGNSILTVLGTLVVAYLVYGIVDWGIIRAVWEADDGKPCRAEGVGACWPFVTHKFGQFMYGRYPDDERWRVNLTYILAVIGLVGLMVPMIPGKRWTALYMIVIFPVIAFILLQGGLFGLPLVETEFGAVYS